MSNQFLFPRICYSETCNHLWLICGFFYLPPFSTPFSTLSVNPLTLDKREERIEGKTMLLLNYFKFLGASLIFTVTYLISSLCRTTQQTATNSKPNPQCLGIYTPSPMSHSRRNYLQLAKSHPCCGKSVSCCG